MKIIKRNGAEVVFDVNKIEMAITKANNAAEEVQNDNPCRYDMRKLKISCAKQANRERSKSNCTERVGENSTHIFHCECVTVETERSACFFLAKPL